ncbi:hypothetical protein CC85DRAFT_281816 [Cutaneotrichosporon oleaginosum]|uniref:Mid2 domain-containing protein n=1 Tax=Cutaneotrichosporon oleaginosum TaxID=879819 RepID=A0A0J0XYN8_9TREE|nr:uncharacterized protein CC85DRAFT_281816 [Cutaneotrichosporon oleaginosum]KLT46163.1 hypothetical protein CC85DRAFT_281816 [Cutaneotrichosporon oleaginosum]TXT10172.1 hypothetical protein COLE_04106 [Cutaneotrichosporon oleaginosum]
MRVVSLAALAALPALVAADPAWHHRHRNRQPAAWHQRSGLAERQGGVLASLISDVLNPGGDVSSTSSTQRPTSSPLSQSSTSTPASSTQRPPSSSSSASSARPTSSSAAPSSSPTSETSSATPTSEAPSTTEEPSSSTSSSTSSSSEPSVRYITKTVDGQAQVVTETPANSDKAGGGSIGTGAIVGIAVGAGVVVIAIVAVIIMFARRSRSSSDDDAIRWPELNHHGDTEVQHALPVHQSDKHGVGDRRMSLGSELDEPQYLQPENDYPHNGAQGGLGGSAFGAAADFNNYDSEKYAYDPNPPQHRAVSPYSYDDDNYTTFPPPVQPQPSPVHGVRPDWATDGSYSDGHTGHNGYATMHRGNSPPMAGVGSYFASGQHSPPPMAGVGAGGMGYPPPQQPHY